MGDGQLVSGTSRVRGGFTGQRPAAEPSGAVGSWVRPVATGRVRKGLGSWLGFPCFFKKTRTQQDSMLRSCAVQVRKLYHGALEKTHLFLWELMNKIINCLRVALKSSGADVGVFLCVCVCLGRC